MSFQESPFLGDLQANQPGQYPWAGDFMSASLPSAPSLNTLLNEPQPGIVPMVNPGINRSGPSNLIGVGGHESMEGGPEGRRRWKNSWVKFLCDLKRNEWVEVENSFQRDHIVGSAVKWDCIATKIWNERFRCIGKQCKNKWDTILSQYKKVREHQVGTSNELYWLLSPAERKAKGLLATFEEDWYEMLESFMGQRPCMTPASVADSSLISDNIDNIEEGDPIEKSMTRKWKRSGESVQKIVDAIDSSMRDFIHVIKEVEKDMRVLMKEVEGERNGVMKENCKELCGVLGVLATAFTEVGRIRKQ